MLTHLKDLLNRHPRGPEPLPGPADPSSFYLRAICKEDAHNFNDFLKIILNSPKAFPTRNTKTATDSELYSMLRGADEAVKEDPDIFLPLFILLAVPSSDAIANGHHSKIGPHSAIKCAVDESSTEPARYNPGVFPILGAAVLTPYQFSSFAYDKTATVSILTIDHERVGVHLYRALHEHLLAEVFMQCKARRIGYTNFISEYPSYQDRGNRISVHDIYEEHEFRTVGKYIGVAQNHGETIDMLLMQRRDEDIAAAKAEKEFEKTIGIAQ